MPGDREPASHPGKEARSNPARYEVSALKLDNPELEHQIANFEQTSQAFASALVALNGERTLTRDLAAATKSFDAQVDALKATVSAAQDFCKS